jgi:flagellar basal-body rod modification protein FlgD
MGKEEFLQLLVAQLRNQDPLSPADPKDFAAQLAQFSTVEQLLNLNSEMKSQAELQASIIGSVNSVAALQLIGRHVIVEGNEVELPAQGNASISVDVDSNGGEGELVLRDENGIEVERLSLPRVEGGRQTIDLSGLVGRVPGGKYTYSIELNDSAGEPVAVTTYSRLKIDALRYTQSGPVLMSGELAFALGQVVEISD